MSFNLDNISSKSLSKQCHLKDFGHYPHGAPPKKIRSSLLRKKCQGQKFSLLKDKVRRKVCNFVKFSSFDQDSLEFILFSREEATNWEGLTIKQVLLRLFLLGWIKFQWACCEGFSPSCPSSRSCDQPPLVQCTVWYSSKSCSRLGKGVENSTSAFFTPKISTKNA